MLIKDIKDIISDIKLTNNQLVWISAFLLLIIISGGGYFFFKEKPKENNTEFIAEFSKMKSDNNRLYLAVNNLSNTISTLNDRINKLSDNTDKRFVYVTKQLSANKDKAGNIIDVIDMTKLEKTQLQKNTESIKQNTESIEENKENIEENKEDIQKLQKDRSSIDYNDTGIVQLAKVSDEPELIPSKKIEIHNNVKDVKIDTNVVEKKPGFFKRVVSAISGD